MMDSHMLTPFKIMDLPLELVKYILKNLNETDEILIIPKVSRVFLSISKSFNSLNRYIKKNLAYEIKLHGMNDEQILEIENLIKKNCFINPLRNTPFKFAYKNEDFVRYHTQISMNMHHNAHSFYKDSEYHDKRLSSESFSVTSKTHQSVEDHSFKVVISIDKMVFQDKSKEILANEVIEKNYSVFLAQGSCPSKHLRSYWIFNRTYYSQAETYKRLIKYAFNLQIKLLNEYFTHLNLIKLSEVTFEQLKNKHSHFYYTNHFGVIKSRTDKSPHKFSLRVKNFENDCSILFWNTIGIDREEKLKSIDFIRLSVYSLTVHELSKKFGIHVENFKLNKQFV